MHRTTAAVVACSKPAPPLPRLPASVTLLAQLAILAVLTHVAARTGTVKGRAALSAGRALAAALVCCVGQVAP